MARLGIDAPTFLRLARHGDGPHPDHQLVAPSWLRSQALQLLLDEVGSGSVSEREALGLHERMTTTKVRVLGDRVSRRTAWDLARRHGWAQLAPAECLAVTRLQADALVTVDPQLARLADGVVPLAPFDALFEA
jgi:hypothetical protein